MTPPRRLARLAATGAALALGAGLLTACQKPLPEVTVLANKTVTQIKAQAYCFDTAHCRKSSANLKSVSARAGSMINIDVPDAIADKAWLVSAYSLDSSNKATAIEGAGTTLLRDSHNAQVTVPFTGAVYYLAVQQTNGTTATGIWQFEVHITGTDQSNAS